MALSYNFASKMTTGQQEVIVMCSPSIPVLPEFVVELVECGTRPVGVDLFGFSSPERCSLQEGTSPSLLPGWQGDGQLPSALGASKIVVFCADPRLGVQPESLQSSLGENGSMARCIQDMAEWAALESSYPDQVRLFFVEDFVSDASAAARGLGQFLGVRASSTKTLNQLQDVALGAEHLAELQQEVGNQAMGSRMEKLFAPWLRSSNAFLQNFGERLRQEVAQWSQTKDEQPSALTTRDWSAEHELGTCNPCIFAMRNTCRNGAACQHCHLPGHAKPKRASKKKRDQKKERLARLCRTPSPEWRAYGAEVPRSLPALPLPAQTYMQPVLATPAYFAIPVYCN